MIKRNLRTRCKLYLKAAEQAASSLGERRTILQYIRDIGIDIIYDGTGEVTQMDGQISLHKRKCVCFYNNNEPVTNNHIVEFPDATRWEVTDVGIENQNQRQFLTLEKYGS